jgi:hypothetical protein
LSWETLVGVVVSMALVWLLLLGLFWLLRPKDLPLR